MLGDRTAPTSGPELIDSASRDELEIIAARLLKEWARTQPLANKMALVHVAVRLESFAEADRG